jgi:hypothetical protein
VVIFPLQLICNQHDLTIEQLTNQPKDLQMQVYKRLSDVLDLKNIPKAKQQPLRDHSELSMAQKAERYNADPDFVAQNLRDALVLQNQILAQHRNDCEKGEQPENYMMKVTPPGSLESVTGRIPASGEGALHFDTAGSPDFLRAVFQEHESHAAAFAVLPILEENLGINTNAKKVKITTK